MVVGRQLLLVYQRDYTRYCLVTTLLEVTVCAGSYRVAAPVAGDDVAKRRTRPSRSPVYRSIRKNLKEDFVHSPLQGSNRTNFTTTVNRSLVIARSAPVGSRCRSDTVGGPYPPGGTPSVRSTKTPTLRNTCGIQLAARPTRSTGTVVKRGRVPRGSEQPTAASADRCPLPSSPAIARTAPVGRHHPTGRPRH